MPTPLISSYSALSQLQNLSKWKELTNMEKLTFGIAMLRDVNFNSNELLRNNYLLDALGINDLRISSNPNYEESINNLVKKFRSQSQYGAHEKQNISEKINHMDSKVVSEFSNLCLELIDKTRNINKDSHNFSHDKLLEYATNFNANGYLVIEGFFDDILISNLDNALARIELYESKTTGHLYANGKIQRCYNLVSKDPIFRELLKNNDLNNLLNILFDRQTLHDKYYLSSMQSNTISFGAPNQPWHVDNNTPEPLANWLMRIQCIVNLTDFTNQNGGSYIYPKSHTFCRIPPETLPKHEERNTVQISCPKGSLILWDGRTWHKAGNNKTKEKRRAILNCYASSVLREVCMEEDFSKVMPDEVKSKLTLTEKRILGFNHGIKKGALNIQPE